jgi:hypothetical protein
MVALVFGYSSDLVGKRQSLGKVLELEDSFQAFDAFSFCNLPIWDLWVKVSDFCLS